MSWIGEIEKARAEAAARKSDPFRLPLERLQGKVGDDGVERLTTQAVLDVLEVPQRNRRAGLYRRLSRAMVGLGWTPVRVRGLTRGSYFEQVRGYSREARNHFTVPDRDRAPSTGAPV
jgi:hypothetical protein